MEQIVGTAGHIDHGKTALVHALTGIDADRLPEEKRRGITIDLGFAEATIGDTHFGFVDVPGHERFVKNMLAGASGIDIVLLVVAASEGVMPQTREHFDICRLLGIERGVVALTKTDLVDAETIELAQIDVAEMTRGSFLENAPVINVSSVSGTGIEELGRALVNAVAENGPSQIGLAARLPIDRSFSMKGFGTVVTGTLVAGQIAEGDEMELLPQRRKARVRGLQTHGRAAKAVGAGKRTAVNLAGIDHAEIERGMTLATPSVFVPTQAVDVRLEVLSDAPKPLRSRQRVRFHIGTAEVLGRLQVLNEKGEIAPGDQGLAQVRLESEAIAVIGDRFILRSYSPQRTVAGGVILDPFAARHRRPELTNVAAHLKGVADAVGNADAVVRKMIDLAGTNGLSIAETVSRLGTTPQSAEALLQAMVRSGGGALAGGRYFAPSVLDDLANQMVAAVSDFHKREPLAKGMPRELLRERAFQGISEDVFRAILTVLETQVKIAADKETVRVAGSGRKLGKEESAFVGTLNDTYNKAGLAAPKFAEAIAEAMDRGSVGDSDAQKLVRMMLDSRELIKVSDELYFSGEAIDALIEKLRTADLPDRSIDVATFKELAGVSRKYAIPLLEYFDREKITVRAGDKRLIL